MASTAPAPAWHHATMPDLQVYAPQVAGILCVLAAFDLLVARHTKARYFAIHVLANSIVTISVLPGCFKLLSNPAVGLRLDEFSSMGISANLCIHVYHMAAFRDLTWLDWLHHITMTIILMPITFAHDAWFGLTCDLQNFFSCGLPGGADYAMLLAVKQGWMEPLTEKRINSQINVWLRAPGIVFTCGLGFTQAFLKDPHLHFLSPAFFFSGLTLGLFIWNAQYFSERVVGNYYVRQYQADEKRKPARNGKNN
ncbi:uncharacterized protein LOC135829385 [Sycon ciliatum]|uniref:uncharacterized protein LOC135829385 n=1 Tax=Sycon ciliatum TaxID=27933 RepID=UPI0020AB7312|eukprot:scpid77508/ scgid28926/ 